MSEVCDDYHLAGRVDKIPYLSREESKESSDDQVSKIHAILTEKAGEICKERMAIVERVNDMEQMVAKQIKSVIDSRLK